MIEPNVKEIGVLQQIELMLSLAAEKDPNELSQGLSEVAGENIDVSLMSDNELLAVFLELLAEDPDKMEEFIDSMDLEVPMPEKKSEYSNVSGLNCDCCDTHYPNSPCYNDCLYEWCEDGGYVGTFEQCFDPTATNYGDLSECDYGSVAGNLGATIVNFGTSVIEAVGLDNIVGWVLGGGTNQTSTGGGGTTPPDDDDDDDDENAISWGMVALIAVGVLALGLTIYFVARKKD
jgi:hypothetical protein